MHPGCLPGHQLIEALFFVLELRAELLEKARTQAARQAIERTANELEASANARVESWWVSESQRVSVRSYESVRARVAVESAVL
jgi:hypothetical protein